MSRPLRLEFPGALYHITCRGDRREAIYLDDADRTAHLQVLSDALDRFDARPPGTALFPLAAIGVHSKELEAFASMP
jgi:hypothetical protein